MIEPLIFVDRVVHRRTLMGFTFACAAVTAMAPGLCCAGAAAAPVVGGKGYVLKPLGGGLFFVSDGGYNTMFLVTDAGVVACDAPPSLGERYLHAIAEVTEKPVTHLIYSHEHVDHIAAATIFQATNPVIIGCRETAKLLASRRDARRPVPTLVYDEHHRLEVGGKVLELAWRGINHSLDTTFIYAPAQRTLMAVDLVYPQWMPYKNLGVAIDIPGLVEAHYTLLDYPFDTLVAGHVGEPGGRQDVETALELLRDLSDAAELAYARLSFPAFLATPGAGTSWERHQPYEQALVDFMIAEIRPKWIDRVKGVDVYLRDNCWAMLETFVVQGRPNFRS